jgi:oxygen-independent coproporphyrinogen-3 oxidase
MVEGLVETARDLGFDSINFDLIYGLPKQSVATLSKTLAQVEALAPDRIAFYNYAHLPERFSSQRAIDRMQLPSADEKLAMVNSISEHLCAAGYLFIGIDHFVKPSDALAKAQSQGRLQRNFQGYSTQKAHDLIGLGVSSISSGELFFSQNQKVLDDYYRVLDQALLPVEKGYKVTSDDLMRRSIIMQLISNLYFDIAPWQREWRCQFTEVFSSELLELQQMQADGLLLVDDKGIRILPKGRAMLRSICLVFDAYHKVALVRFSNVL